MKTTTDRIASAKKAWDTMRARKAAGLPPLSADKAATKPEKDYSGLIGAWLTPVPAPEPIAIPPTLPEPAATATTTIPPAKAKAAKTAKTTKKAAKSKARKPVAKKRKAA